MNRSAWLSVAAVFGIFLLAWKGIVVVTGLRPFILPPPETVASRFDLITCPEAVRVVDRLYWDEDRQAPKVGAVDVPSKGKPPLPGTLRALDLVLSQLACTYDIRSMSERQILEKLPDEFSRFLDA